RHGADRRGELVADLADASMPVDEVERLVAERCPLPVRLAGQEARPRQMCARQVIVEPGTAESIHRPFAADPAIDGTGWHGWPSQRQRIGESPFIANDDRSETLHRAEHLAIGPPIMPPRREKIVLGRPRSAKLRD